MLHIRSKIDVVIADNASPGLPDRPVQCPSPSLAFIMVKETDPAILFFILPDKLRAAIGTPVLGDQDFKITGNTGEYINGRFEGDLKRGAIIEDGDNGSYFSSRQGYSSCRHRLPLLFLP
jgi:hypothetical protein